MAAGGDAQAARRRVEDSTHANCCYLPGPRGSLRVARAYLAVTEKFFDPKFMPPDDEVISNPYCTSPTTRSLIQPRFFR
jgi:hypothetical protein